MTLSICYIRLKLSFVWGVKFLALTYRRTSIVSEWEKDRVGNIFVRTVVNQSINVTSTAIDWKVYLILLNYEILDPTTAPAPTINALFDYKEPLLFSFAWYYNVGFTITYVVLLNSFQLNNASSVNQAYANCIYLRIFFTLTLKQCYAFYYRSERGAATHTLSTRI